MNHDIPPRPPRLPALPADAWTSAQRLVAAELAAGPRGEVRGPFAALLRSPELCDRTQKLGEYLRYRSAVPEALKEFAVLIAARVWQQSYEWHVHAPIAERCGVERSIIAELGANRRPARLSEQQAVVYDFCTQLHLSRCVDDVTYTRALELLGEAGVVDLSGICGYYALLAMVLNVARTPIPATASIPFPPPD